MFEVKDVFDGDYVEVKLTTSESILGVVINLKGDLVLIKEYVDFTFVGYKLIPNSFVSEIVVAQPADIYGKIVKGEELGSMDECFEFLTGAKCWEGLVREIFSRGLVCIYHKDEESVHLGRLINDNPDRLTMICIDTQFRYEKEPFVLEKNAVSMVELGSEYARIYATYSRN